MKTILLTISYLLFFTNITVSQNSNWFYQIDYSSLPFQLNETRFMDSTVDEFGDIYVLGESYTRQIDDSKYFIAKLDNNGQLLGSINLFLIDNPNGDFGEVFTSIEMWTRQIML